MEQDTHDVTQTPGMQDLWLYASRHSKLPVSHGLQGPQGIGPIGKGGTHVGPSCSPLSLSSFAGTSDAEAVTRGADTALLVCTI